MHVKSCRCCSESKVAAAFLGIQIFATRGFTGGIIRYHAFQCDAGTVAQFISVREDWLTEIPGDVPDDVAGATPLVALTAYQVRFQYSTALYIYIYVYHPCLTVHSNSYFQCPEVSCLVMPDIMTDGLPFIMSQVWHIFWS